MAEKRMFSKQIIDSDAFLSMPLSTQALYFHFSMRADDDGFVDKPKSIMRLIGSNEGDIKPLIEKRYILCFNSGVIVIKHWKIHNYIQKDRYKKTNYVEELSQLDVKSNKSYTEKASEKQDKIMPCIHSVSKVDTQIRLDKIRLDKIREDILSEKSDKNVVKNRFDEFWKSYPKKIGKGAAEKAYKKIKPTAELQSQILSAVEKAKQTEQWQKQNGQFIPHPATWLNQKRWEDEYQISNTNSEGIESSFDTDECFQAAVKRSMRE